MSTTLLIIPASLSSSSIDIEIEMEIEIEIIQLKLWETILEGRN